MIRMENNGNVLLNYDYEYAMATVLKKQENGINISMDMIRKKSINMIP